MLRLRRAPHRGDDQRQCGKSGTFWHYLALFDGATWPISQNGNDLRFSSNLRVPLFERGWLPERIAFENDRVTETSRHAITSGGRRSSWHTRVDLLLSSLTNCPEAGKPDLQSKPVPRRLGWAERKWRKMALRAYPVGRTFDFARCPVSPGRVGSSHRHRASRWPATVGGAHPYDSARPTRHILLAASMGTSCRARALGAGCWADEGIGLTKAGVRSALAGAKLSRAPAGRSEPCVFN